jgi:hypothetical protein
MSKKRVPSVRPAVRPPPRDARPKDPSLAPPPAGDSRRPSPSPAAPDRSGTVVTKSKPSPAAARASVTEREIARRAYDLYLARGCEQGHDVEDWLQAERDLRAALRSAKPWVM